MKEPERVSHHSPGLWEKKPLRTAAFSDAVQQDLEPARDRLFPGVSREAAGAPALLPEPWRHVSLKAVWRLRRSESTRASW
jgi:hypothetical protein